MIDFFQALILITCFLILITNHPVYAVIFLIFLFCEASFILFLFNVEFLGLLLIIVYVGAIAVLFLFVVMLLNIKIIKSLFNLYYAFYFLLFFFLFKIGYLLLFEYSLEVITSFSIINYLFLLTESIHYDSLTNLQVLSQMLFNEYSFIVLLLGLVLLIPLLSAISLTFVYSNVSNSAVTLVQLSRGQKVLSLFS